MPPDPLVPGDPNAHPRAPKHDSLTQYSVLVQSRARLISPRCGRILSLIVFLLPRALFPQAARDVLNLVARTYSSCESYQDEGKATTTYILNNNKRITEKPFSTAFVRQGSRLRYEYTELMPGNGRVSRYLIWLNGDQVKTWWTAKPRVAIGASFDEAISAAAGVSGLSSSIVPTLLMPARMSHNTFDNYLDFQIGKPKVIEEVSVISIIGTLSMGPVKITYWVGVRDHLIRVVEWAEKPSREYTVQNVLTYSPTLNRPVPPSKLVFDPPDDSK